MNLASVMHASYLKFKNHELARIIDLYIMNELCVDHYSTQPSDQCSEVEILAIEEFQVAIWDIKHH
jgi:hypothetical protein